MSKVKLDTRRLNSIVNNIEDTTENFIKSIGFSVEARAKTKSPTDTSANKNSIYTSTKTEEHGRDMSIANTLGRDSYNLPRGTKTKVYVGPSMSYSIHLEFGTNRMAARPYLIPALEEVASQLQYHYKLIIP